MDDLTLPGMDDAALSPLNMLQLETLGLQRSLAFMHDAGKAAVEYFADVDALNRPRGWGESIGDLFEGLDDLAARRQAQAGKLAHASSKGDRALGAALGTAMTILKHLESRGVAIEEARRALTNMKPAGSLPAALGMVEGIVRTTVELSLPKLA